MAGATRDSWRSLIGKQRASGASVRQFCGKQGVGENSFYRWRKRLSEREPIRFRLVETGGLTQVGEALELVLVTGERLRIAPGADAGTLRAVLEILRH